MTPESPFDLLVDAFRDAKKQMIEATRVVQADIVRPLNPNDSKMSRVQRREEFNNFLLNPSIRESEFLRLQQRFNLPPDRPISRRLVEYVIRGLQEAE